MISIDGYPTYRIDKKGNIFSDKIGGYKTHQSDKDGYSVVTLTSGKMRRTFKIHRLLAIYFIPNPQDKPLVNHKNGIKNDNRLENLEWCTHKENVQHAYDAGLQEGIKGERNANSKLTKQDVIFIRHWHNKHKLADIAESFNVSKSLICKVVYRKCWTHLSEGQL
jgi:hypothetical protein